MLVTPLPLSPSPDRDGYVRLAARVSYGDRAVADETYWIEAPEAYASSLSPNGSPWLACLLPLAMTLGEELRIEAPVDGALYEGVQDLMRMWRYWFPPLRVVPIVADSVGGPPHADGARRVGAFFSGGVDSFFTLLRREHEGRVNPHVAVDDMILVWGFDVPLSDRAAFDRMHQSVCRVAGELGKSLIDVATNVRQTRFRQVPWAKIAHGPALAAVALSLEPRFRAVALAAAREYPLASAGWGSHPASDQLFSTHRMRLVHDGGTYSRVDKVCFIADSELALRHLHVCWRSQSDRNCGECEKCYRTMTTLEIAGALERCPTFPESRLDLDRVARMYCYNWVTKGFNRSNRALAIERNRPDIAAALDRSFNMSRRRDRIRAAADLVSRTPFAWRFAGPLHRAVVRDVIH